MNTLVKAVLAIAGLVVCAYAIYFMYRALGVGSSKDKQKWAKRKGLDGKGNAPYKRPVD
ncbi:unnamed protein product [marine sediment metagenome]|uniref:Uncharacterized protein n=1 Tax=marine sediment metagenome TaxID=412755 RepID=X0XDW1_9ZZZZ